MVSSLLGVIKNQNLCWEAQKQISVLGGFSHGVLWSNVSDGPVLILVPKFATDFFHQLAQSKVVAIITLLPLCYALVRDIKVCETEVTGYLQFPANFLRAGIANPNVCRAR